MPVNGFCVETLKTLGTFCLSADFVLRLWKRCACQRILCCDSGNAVPLPDICCDSGIVVPVSDF